MKGHKKLACSTSPNRNCSWASNQVKERAAQITTPPPGSARVHNDSETWKAESPNLHAADSDANARLFRWSGPPSRSTGTAGVET
jgi:hypothetical protein